MVMVNATGCMLVAQIYLSTGAFVHTVSMATGVSSATTIASITAAFTADASITFNDMAVSVTTVTMVNIANGVVKIRMVRRTGVRTTMMAVAMTKATTRRGSSLRCYF